MRGRALLVALAAAGCTRPIRPAPSRHDEGRGFDVRLAQQANGTWTASYRFDRARSALLFDSAGRPRSTYWTAATGGVTLENLHGLDVLLLDPPASRARFTILPPPPAAGQTVGAPPFLLFSDGSVAIDLGQLTVLTVADRAEAEALHGSLRAWHGEQPTVQVTLASNQPMLLPDGQQATGVAHVPVRGGGGYVYIGNIGLRHTDDYVAVVDPGLPRWLADRFPDDLAHIYRAYRARWQGRASRAVILLAFSPADGPEGNFANRGHVVGSQIALSVRGSAYAHEDPAALHRLLWFFAHEIAHQFQFRDGIKSVPGSDWITEGSADTMATVVLYDLGLTDKRQLERRYWQVHRECIEDLGKGQLQGQRGRAGYVCGDLIAEMTAASLPDHDLFAFWNALREQARLYDHSKLTGSLNFAVLRARGAPSAVIVSLQQIVGTRLGDARTTLDAAMRSSGLQPVFAGDGGLSTMRFPAITPHHPS